MKIVTGIGENPHVTSKEFREIMEGVLGRGSYILTSGSNMSHELISNNLLRINSGTMAHHGNISSIEVYDEVEISNGTQGVKRIDLVVNRYRKDASTEIESNTWIVIQGTPDVENPAIPEYIIGNMQEGDLVDDCPVFAIYLDGLNVTKIETLLDVMLCMGELNDDVVLWSGDNTSSGTLTLSDDLFKYNRVVFMLDNAVVYEIPVVKGMTVAGDASVRKERNLEVEVCDLVVSDISSETIKISSHSRGFLVGTNRFVTGPVYINKIIGKH